MFTCTTLRHALLELQTNKGVYPKASKSKLTADRPHSSNYFNYKNDGGNNASSCAATVRKLLTLPGVSDTYPFLMNPWNTLLESYQPRVSKNTLASVKHQIQQVENPTPPVVISVEAVRVHIAILLDHLTSEVALEDHEIGSTDPTIQTDNNCTDDKLHLRMPGGSGNYKDDSDESDKPNVIPTTSWQRWPMTELECFDLGTSDFDRLKCEDGDDADADDEEEASQADDGSMQNVEH